MVKYLTKTSIAAGCDFCSQMSQYATLKVLAKEKNFEVVFREGDLHRGYGYHLDKCFTHIPAITNAPIEFKTISGSHWGKFPADYLGQDNYDFALDISCYKSFHHEYDYIRELYTFKPEIVSIGNEYLNSIKQDDEVLVAVHFRRGDYLIYSSLKLSLDYYNTAVSLMQEKLAGKKIKFLVFSNGMDWVKENFKPDNVVYCDLNDRFVELYLQTVCDHCIIANSSYSFWGAYLNNTPNKIVICPIKYSGNPEIDGNYYPLDWLAIDKV